MPAGRPSKFNEAIREKIIALCEAGKTNEQIADIIGVHVRTIENWQGKYPQLLWAMREAKQIADDLVEAALFARAVGYTHKEEKIFQYEGEIVRAETLKHYPPDTVAALHWLQVRRPEEWREKKTVVHEGGERPIQIQAFDLEERVKQLQEASPEMPVTSEEEL